VDAVDSVLEYDAGKVGGDFARLDVGDVDR
jgi:hypothetical protein